MNDKQRSTPKQWKLQSTTSKVIYTKKYVKEKLEELNIFYFNIIKQKTPYSILVKGSVKKGSSKEMISKEEVRNWFVQKTKYNDNTQKAYALIYDNRNKD